MKFFSTTALAAAICASATLAAASLETSSNVHVVDGHIARRDASHHGALAKRKCKSSKKSKKTKTSSKATVSSSGQSLKLSSKQGLAWPNSGGINIEPFFVGGVDWYYSWKATPGWDSAPTDKLFCPMLWGDSGSGGNAADFKKHVTDDPNGKWNGYKCMLGPNEVNQKGQSDMSPQQACSLMRKYMMPLADQGWYFIGPSTTSAPNGLDWYKEFMSSCSDVYSRMDAVALHYYDVDVDKFKAYVENWRKVTGKKIWITEFACQNFNGGAQCSKSDAYNFLKEMSEWFEEQDYVVAYSPFGAMQNLQGVSEVNRLSIGSSPTSLFRMFANI